MSRLTRGERFKDARTVFNKNKKETMDEVFAATGVSKSAIQALEDDSISRSVGYDKVAKLSEHYGVSADYLLCLSDDPRLAHSAVDELGLSTYSISWLERLKTYGEDDPNFRRIINSIFEDLVFQKTVFNIANYIEALGIETLSFKCYMEKMEYGPGREAEAWQAYADEILLLSQDPKFSERQRQLLKAEHERFTLDKDALWAVLSGDDAGFHFSKMFAYRANTYFASLLTKFETEAQKQRDEYSAHILNSLDSEE